MRLHLHFFVATSLLFFAHQSYAQGIQVIGYNVESGGSDPNVVVTRIAEINGCDVWGFSEVQNASWGSIFETGAENGENADFSQVLGKTGGADRLLVVYNDTEIDLVSHQELDSINIGGTGRSPLVCRLKVVSSGQEFLFMVNHLFRGDADKRHKQARMLNNWASQQSLPVIAVGDYNFDWSVTNGDTDHDQGYDNLVAGDVFRWVRPAQLIKTQTSTQNSVLDFVFVAGSARNWQAISTILVKTGDFPDNTQTSDHRPVHASFSFVPATQVTRQDLLDKIADLEEELRNLRALVEQMP